MCDLFVKFISDDSGATAVEYGLFAALITLVIVTLLQSLGTSLVASFQRVVDALS